MRLPLFARLIPAALLFLTATLAVLPAPTHLFWMLAIGVTEWGHFFALICIGAAIPLWNQSWNGRLASGLCITAAALALTPVLRAVRISRDLPGQIDKAFGKATTVVRPPSSTAMPPELLTYKSAGEDLSLDFYRAQAAGRAPLIVVIHGGSWNSGDNQDFVAMDRHLANRGFAVADLIYRLAPRAPFPAASNDVRSAIAFLRERADGLNLDPNRIVLIGRSAGGQIALHVAYTANDPGIRGVISFYGPTDLNWSWEHPGNPLVIDTRAALTDFLGGSPAANAAKYAAASPIRLATKASPPTLLFHGGRDEVVNPYHSDALSHRLTDLGVANLNVVLPWATHGFDYLMSGPGGRISTRAIESFLTRYLSD